MTTPSTNVSVALPVSQAIDRVKQMLFQPFDLNKWFIIGFCAWLAGLGEAGGHANFGNFASHRDGANFQQQFERVRSYVMENLYWILPLFVALVVICFTVGVVMMWLSSRGKFMFLHCVAHDKAEVSEPWHKFARQGNSLFLFRLVLSLIGMFLMLPLVALAVVAVIKMVHRGEADLPGILTLVGIGLALIAVGLVFFILRKFTRDFVVPIMFLRGKKCLEAWREFRSLLSANFGSFVLYLLFQLVLGMVIGTLVLVLILVTCCIAGCFLMIPYLGAVLLLPVSTFKRSYSLYYLAQYGGDYDVFQPVVAPA
jgi:hypothetical protein